MPCVVSLPTAWSEVGHSGIEITQPLTLTLGPIMAGAIAAGKNRGGGRLSSALAAARSGCHRRRVTWRFKEISGPATKPGAIAPPAISAWPRLRNNLEPSIIRESDACVRRGTSGMLLTGADAGCQPEARRWENWGRRGSGLNGLSSGTSIKSSPVSIGAGFPCRIC